VLNKNIN